MKKIILILGILFLVGCKEKSSDVNQKTPDSIQQNEVSLPINTLGIIIYSNDQETVWNALRLANYAQESGDKVSVFLLGKGVELDDMVKTNEDLSEQVDSFLAKNGVILGCGTCLESRKKSESKTCTFSSLSDLYSIIKENDKILTF